MNAIFFENHVTYKNSIHANLKNETLYTSINYNITIIIIELEFMSLSDFNFDNKTHFTR